MKIVVIGGSGLIGSKVVLGLAERGHQAVAASPKTGVNAITGEGLAEALAGATVVVDVSNAPVWEDAAVLEFFQTSTRNLLTAETAAGVRHHVALSVVGTDHLLHSGYFRAKMAQEQLIQAGGVPFSIIRATQFFEFIGAIADAGTRNGTARLTSALMQPIAAQDVADAVVDVALSEPTNRVTELAGPEPFQIDEICRQFLAERSDPREVITDDTAGYYGMTVNRTSLMPGDGPRIGRTRFAEWVRHSAAPRQPAASV